MITLSLLINLIVFCALSLIPVLLFQLDTHENLPLLCLRAVTPMNQS